jgi:hypothetical protein
MSNPNLEMNFTIFDQDAQRQELQKNQAYVNGLNATTNAQGTTQKTQQTAISTLNTNAQVSAVPYSAVDTIRSPSTTIADGVTHLLINPPAAVPTHTVVMPKNPIDGQNTVISAGAFGVTALSLNPNSGQTFSPGSAVTTLAANAVVKYLWVASKNMWFKSG